MITLKHRFAEDLLPVVQPMVGPEGTANATNNILIIRTTPERLAEIEQVVSNLDVGSRNIRIEVSHDRSLQTEDRELSASGRGRVGDTEVVIGRPGRRSGARIEMNRGSSRSSQQGSQFLTVMDGASAFIEVGQSVPYTQVFTQRYAIVQQTTDFQDITTGFAVRPRYIGDEVEVEITPRIATLNTGGFIDFDTLSTRMRVKPGVWFDLGGSMRSRDEVSSAILSSGSSNASESSALMIKVD
ncbi:MAG TPA: secretin N-terminal domain-containing protein [Methylophilaceae bacterium]|nr:secretin N-terminal domain-containing protein [Methylophilaceae bacterium]